jgi:coproporphyrinogen III oxidase-like Fe-S oxidoreductase
MELVFLGLRRTRGIDEDVFRDRCGIRFIDYVKVEKLRAFEQQGLLAYAKPFWEPTKKGILLADGMARELV